MTRDLWQPWIGQGPPRGPKVVERKRRADDSQASAHRDAAPPRATGSGRQVELRDLLAGHSYCVDAIRSSTRLGINRFFEEPGNGALEHGGSPQRPIRAHEPPHGGLVRERRLVGGIVAPAAEQAALGGVREQVAAEMLTPGAFHAGSAGGERLRETRWNGVESQGVEDDTARANGDVTSSPVDSEDPEAIVARERALRDREAGIYDSHVEETPYLRAVEQAVALSALDLQPDQTVVDAGCGTGRLLEPLLDRSAQVVGVDHSSASLEIARARVPKEKLERLNLIACDVRSIPLEDAMADRVLCIGVLQHVPTPEFRTEAVRELRRILKPGGVVVALAYRWLGHIRRHKEGFFGPDLYRYAFTVAEFGALLDSAGFGEISLGGAVIVPALAKRLGVGVELQRRLAFTVAGRHLAHYVVARAKA